jgi:hypothetical protein
MRPSNCIVSIQHLYNDIAAGKACTSFARKNCAIAKVACNDKDTSLLYVNINDLSKKVLYLRHYSF